MGRFFRHLVVGCANALLGGFLWFLSFALYAGLGGSTNLMDLVGLCLTIIMLVGYVIWFVSVQLRTDQMHNTLVKVSALPKPDTES